MDCASAGLRNPAPRRARLGVAFLLGLVLAPSLGCISIGSAPPRPVLSDDPSVGPSACFSECTVLNGCQTRCGYVKQP